MNSQRSSDGGLHAVITGLGRSLILVGLTGVCPALWAGAAAWFFAATGSAGGTAGFLVGIVGASVVPVARPLAQAARKRLSLWTGETLHASYRHVVPVRRMATGYWWNGHSYQRLRFVALAQRWLRARTRDPVAWLDVIWVVASPVIVGVAAAAPPALVLMGLVGLMGPGLLPVILPVVAVIGLSVLSIILGLALAPLGWRIAAPLMRLLLAGLPLVGSHRLAALLRERADLTQAQDAELQRIARDLHDGAQVRLVAVGLAIGAAERVIDTDPEHSKALLREARDLSRGALSSLRELVHDIVPPVLLERGYIDAIRALALDVPVPTTVRTVLRERLETPIEAAFYFAVAELLSNVIKHADASEISVLVERQGEHVVATVTDDGRGGADKRLGSGLAGVAARVAVFGGSLLVDSPTGGPTRVVVEIPCG